MTISDLPAVRIRLRMLSDEALQDQGYLSMLEGNKHSGDCMSRIRTRQEKLNSDISELKEQRNQILQDLELLPVNQRTVLLLHYEGGYTWGKVADTMDLSLRWVHRLKEVAIVKRGTCGSDPEGERAADRAMAEHEAVYKVHREEVPGPG